MPTTSVRKSQKKVDNIQSIQKIMASLEKVAPQAQQIETLSPDKLIEQLDIIQRKRSPEKKAMLKRVDLVSEFLGMVRQALVSNNDLDLLEKGIRYNAVKNLQRMVDHGLLIEAGELIGHLEWTRQALSKARQARRVFSVDVKGKSYYPAFFTEPKYERRHLEAVSKALGDLPGTSKLQFMLTPKGSLGSLSPLQALAKGKIADVKIAAESFAMG